MNRDGRNGIGFSVRYIRTDGYIDGAEYPVFTIIRSRDELKRYYDLYKDVYDFSSHAQRYSEETSSFADAMVQFTDAFFSEHYLVVVMLEEGSGSIRHQVKQIEENGDIVIHRVVPEIGTADMAQWTILIGLNSRFKQNQFHILMTQSMSEE